MGFGLHGRANPSNAGKKHERSLDGQARDEGTCCAKKMGAERILRHWLVGREIVKAAAKKMTLRHTGCTMRLKDGSQKPGPEGFWK